MSAPLLQLLLRPLWPLYENEDDAVENRHCQILYEERKWNAVNEEPEMKEKPVDEKMEILRVKEEEDYRGVKYEGEGEEEGRAKKNLLGSPWRYCDVKKVIQM